MSEQPDLCLRLRQDDRSTRDPRRTQNCGCKTWREGLYEISPRRGCLSIGLLLYESVFLNPAHTRYPGLVSA